MESPGALAHRRGKGGTIGQVDRRSKKGDSYVGKGFFNWTRKRTRVWS